MTEPLQDKLVRSLFIIFENFESLLTIVDVANIVKSRLSKKISLLLLIWRNTNLGGTLPLSRPLIIKRHHLTLTHFIANITLQRGGIWTLSLKHHRKYFQSPQKNYLSKIISYGFLLYSQVIELDLESHSQSRDKGQFFETRLRTIFLALTWRDEIEIIVWPFSYFETRTRLHIASLMLRDEVET